MTAKKKYRFEDFTWTNYSRLLDIMRSSYRLATFSEALDSDSWLVLRHDVDFSLLDALPIAQLEAERGIRATYFVLLRSDCYNPLEQTSIAVLRELMHLGHEVGLHFDWSFPPLQETPWEKRLAQERDLLASLLCRDVTAFSFHNPDSGALKCAETRYAGMMNAYADAFRTNASYCSDSNGIWRFRSLEEVLVADRPERLQVLTHPEHWTREVTSPRQRVNQSIDAIGHRIKRRYEEALRSGGRTDVDWETP